MWILVGISCLHVYVTQLLLPHCPVPCPVCCCQASFSERERDLLRQLEAARRHHSTPQHTAAANKRAAAAAAATEEQVAESLRSQLASQAESHQQELTALQTQLQW
jgi:hypothetical protein